jgi:uncharacterized protein
MSHETQCAIAVMAKAPRPGHVKTRLVPPLTPTEATAMSASFLRDITENVRRASEDAPIRGYVAYAPAGSEPLFDGVLAPGTQLVLADGARDMPLRVQGFGRSLLHAAQALFEQGYGSVCLLNSDSPTLPTAWLREAARMLAAPGDRVVLGPAADGGYYLLGMKAPHARLFEDIAWSTGSVAEATQERARSLGLELAMLEPWYDVDDESALQRLFHELAATSPSDRDNHAPYHAATTAACIARLGLAAHIGRPAAKAQSAAQ